MRICDTELDLFAHKGLNRFANHHSGDAHSFAWLHVPIHEKDTCIKNITRETIISSDLLSDKFISTGCLYYKRKIRLNFIEFRAGKLLRYSDNTLNKYISLCNPNQPVIQSGTFHRRRAVVKGRGGKREIGHELSLYRGTTTNVKRDQLKSPGSFTSLSRTSLETCLKRRSSPPRNLHIH